MQIDRRALRRSLGSRTTRRRGPKRAPFGYTLNKRPAIKMKQMIKNYKSYEE